jgi:hypothetical protein
VHRLCEINYTTLCERPEYPRGLVSSGGPGILITEYHTEEDCILNYSV